MFVMHHASARDKYYDQGCKTLQRGKVQEVNQAACIKNGESVLTKHYIMAMHAWKVGVLDKGKSCFKIALAFPIISLRQWSTTSSHIQRNIEECFNILID